MLSSLDKEEFEGSRISNWESSTQLSAKFSRWYTCKNIFKEISTYIFNFHMYFILKLISPDNFPPTFQNKGSLFPLNLTMDYCIRV